MTALGIVALAAVAANPFAATFEQAVQAYEKGDYASSILQYEQLLREGIEDADLFYNLGNAYFRQGAIAEAIANYERALFLRPAFDNAQHNLRLCVQLTEQRLARPPLPAWQESLFFWSATMPPGVTCAAALALWLAFWGILATRFWRRFPYHKLTVVGLLALAAAFAGATWIKTRPSGLAITRPETAPVRFGTGEQEKVRFELKKGDRVRVERRENGWSRVATADGARGWTPDSNLIFVGPPFSPLDPAEENAS